MNLLLVSPTYKIIQLDETESTNDYAKKLILEESINGSCVIFANHQTRGKGRLGRTWESAPGAGLWMSLIVGPGINHERLVLYNFMASLTVCETLREMTGLDFELKWPNDILIRGKKICGILLETTAKNGELYLIIGIGLNINQRIFSEPINQTATSLFLETRTNWEISEVMQKVLKRFDENRSNLNIDIFRRWKMMTTMLGKSISIVQDKTIFDGIAKDIADDGALIVERNGKTDRLYAGDVQVRVNQ